MTDTVLIAGASGLVGAAAVDKFLDDGWDVVAVSRRRPEVVSDRDVPPRPDRPARRRRHRAPPWPTWATSPTSSTPPSTRLPGLVPGWSERDQMETNRDMLRNLMEPLAKGGDARSTSACCRARRPTASTSTRCRSRPASSYPRDQHENFYWLQEDYIREKSAADGWAFSIWRPQLIVGPNYGVVMNLPPIIGAYAAICRKARASRSASPGACRTSGRRSTPGSSPTPWRGAPPPPAAVGETFNLTNGEVFNWRQIWPGMAEVLGVEVGPDEPQSLAQLLPAKADVWDKIVARARPAQRADERTRGRVAPLRRLLLRLRRRPRCRRRRS